jgi:hypothetical protein
VGVEQPLKDGQILPPAAGRAQPARARPILDQGDPVAQVQVVLGDGGAGPHRPVEHRGGSEDALGLTGVGEQVDQHHHLGVAIGQCRRHVQSLGAQRDPPVNAAQAIPGHELA